MRLCWSNWDSRAVVWECKIIWITELGARGFLSKWTSSECWQWASSENVTREHDGRVSRRRRLVTLRPASSAERTVGLDWKRVCSCSQYSAHLNARSAVSQSHSPTRSVWDTASSSRMLVKWLNRASMRLSPLAKHKQINVRSGRSSDSVSVPRSAFAIGWERALRLHFRGTEHHRQCFKIKDLYLTLRSNFWVKCKAFAFNSNNLN